MIALLEGTVFEQPATGVAKAALGLYSACQALMPSLAVAVVHRRRLHAELPPGFAPIRRSRWTSPAAWRRRAIPAAMRAVQPTFVHFPWNGGVPFLPSEIPVVTTLHDVLPLEIPQQFPTAGAREAYAAAVQRDLDRTDLLITDSEYSRRQILAHFRVRSEPVVVRLAGDLPRSNGGQPQGDSRRGYFLYLGGYSARKNLIPLLRLFLQLHAHKALASRLVLTGSPHYFSREFEQLVREGEQRGVVEEAGYVPDAELTALLAGAHALVYPSQHEGFGLPPLEAMAVGCPVITTRGTSIPEVCGDAALYVDPLQGEEFARALQAVEGDEELRQALRARGLAQAAKFSWRRSAETFLAELATLLARPPRSACP